MAEVMAWPLNLAEYSYNAEDVMRFMAGKTSGVFGEEGNFQVSAKSGMTVTVSAQGKTGGWLSNGGKYGISFWNANDIDLTVETADGVNPRKDRVIVSWHIPQQTTVPSVIIRKGTASASPQPPALVNNGEYAEICLAEISVPAGATSITAYNITDTRLDEVLCGIVSMGVEVIPTAGLQAQFEYWFENLKETLSGDVAANLQHEINNHIADTSVHLRSLVHQKSGTTHALTGLSGAGGMVSCQFKAAAAFSAGDTFTVDGTPYAVKLTNGEAAEDNLFVSGAAVSCIVDAAGKTVNFKAAGSGAKLPAGTTAIVKFYVPETDSGSLAETFIVPETGDYRVTVVGKGGNGGFSGTDSWNDVGGGGGGSGGWCRSVLKLQKGSSYPITVNASLSSFGSLLSASSGKEGESGTSDYGTGAGGLAGTASGGNEKNHNGKRGISGTRDKGGDGAAVESPEESVFLSASGGKGGNGSDSSDPGRAPRSKSIYAAIGNGAGGSATRRPGSSGATRGTAFSGAVVIEMLTK